MPRASDDKSIGKAKAKLADLSMRVDIQIYPSSYGALSLATRKLRKNKAKQRSRIAISYERAESARNP